MSSGNLSMRMRFAREAGATAVTAILVIAVFGLVDLRPEVESDFFFSKNDPQLRTTR